MTKEELEKEAEEFLQKKWGTSKMLILGGDAREVLADFVEPREKQVEIDAEHIRALQKQNGELTDKVKELEAQNEEIENYFVESAGYGRDKVRNFIDIINKALKQKGERITELKAQIEKMKQCGNCGNGTIGNCEHCKRKPNQKSTDTDDYWRLKEIKEK